MASGSSDELTRGARDHRTSATRAVATWQSRGWPTRGVGGAQGATTWQGGHASTRVHVGSRVGRHVAEGGGNTING